MSAVPSGKSNGPTSNDNKPQFVRRSKAIDPLRARKKPLRRPPPSHLRPSPPVLTESKLFYPVNGLAPQKRTFQQQTCAKTLESNGGWTNKPEGEYSDFPLITTKRALHEGLRHHVARFAGKKEVDPWNQNEFTRPVILHRRDPQQPPNKGSKFDELGDDQVIDSKDQEKLEYARAEKEKQRLIDLAQIAPLGNNPSLTSKKIISGRNGKTTQVFRLDKTEEEKKASDLRYEEALPWHIEDADNKNIWVGNYEAALSDVNVAFVIQDGVFKMIPVEKWYKFASKGQFKAYTIDEAEARMGKKVKESRWVMKENEKKEADRANLEGRRAMIQLYTVKSESTTFKNSSKREVEDMDELDFNGDDLFQDDDELATVEPDKDEESKEAQDRIKKEQLGANVFGQANEAEVDKELFEVEKEAEVRKKFGKGVKKALKKRERNYIYDSDSEHPYSETSEDDTSDEEKVKEIDRRLEEENKNKMKSETKSATSAALTKDLSNLVGRSKDNDPLKKSNSRKRPGSPNLSESSGNESTRKKKPKKNYMEMSPEISDPRAESRQILPSSQSSSGHSNRYNTSTKINSNQARASNIHSSQSNYIQNSDNEPARSELSDRAIKRHKSKVPTTNASSRPSSRQCSPALVTSPLGPQKSGPITTSEIISALPPAGISIGNLMKSFGGRVGDDPVTQTKKADFIKLVRENAKYGPDKLLRHK